MNLKRLQAQNYCSLLLNALQLYAGVLHRYLVCQKRSLGHETLSTPRLVQQTTTGMSAVKVAAIIAMLNIVQGHSVPLWAWQR